MLKAHLDGVLLIPVSLRVHIVGKAHLLVSDDIVGLFDLDKQVGCIVIWVLVRMVLDACLPEGLLEFLLGRSSGWNPKQLVVVLRLFYIWKLK